MPYPLDAATEAAIAAGRIKTADLVDFYAKTEGGENAFLRGWDWPGPCSYPANDPAEIDGAVGASNVAYEPLYGRIVVNKQLRLSATLASEPCVIMLDASRSGDDEDWVGRFVDRNWHQCRMRVRQILLNFETEEASTDPVWEFHGLLDHRNLTRKAGEPLAWEVKCQGGLFRVRGRRMRTRSHDDQQKRKAGDMFYRATPLMVAVPLIWAKANASIPAVVTRGGSSGSGGNVPGGKFKNYESLF